MSVVVHCHHSPVFRKDGRCTARCTIVILHTWHIFDGIEIAPEIRDYHIAHHFGVALCHCRRGHPQLRRDLLALKAVNEQHTQDHGILAVTPVICPAKFLYRVAELLGEAVAGHVKTQIRALHPLFKTHVAALFLLLPELVKNQIAETVDHPCQEAHGRTSVFQLAEIVSIELEVIFVGERKEVHTGLADQTVTPVENTVGNLAVVVEVLAHYITVAPAEALDDIICRKVSGFFCGRWCHWF